MVLIEHENDKFKIGIAFMTTLVSMFFLFMFQDNIRDGLKYIKRPDLVSTQGVLTALSKGDSRSYNRVLHYRLFGTYTFVVNGEQRSGSQIGQFAKASVWEKRQAEQLVQSFPQAKDVTVQYDPKNPAYNYADVGSEARSAKFVVGTMWFTGSVCLICVLLWVRVVFLLTRRGGG